MSQGPTLVKYGRPLKPQRGIRDERNVREEAGASGGELHAAQDRLRGVEPGTVRAFFRDPNFPDKVYLECRRSVTT